jgi:5-methylcytosine-specific restriction endonuclease McrA
VLTLPAVACSLMGEDPNHRQPRQADRVKLSVSVKSRCCKLAAVFYGTGYSELYRTVSINGLITGMNTLDRKARAGGFRDYRSYLKSRYWRRLRRLVLERDEFTCQRCGTATDLTVHHWRYDIGREQLEDLITVCPSCHDRMHGRQRVQSARLY